MLTGNKSTSDILSADRVVRMFTLYGEEVMKIKRKRFTVRGSGVFPFDMLRYDHCWPETESNDSHKLDSSRFSNSGFETREVTLLTDSPNAPTHGRWDSFNWKVISEEIVR